MREIKFRVYDDAKRKIYKVHRLDLENQEVVFYEDDFLPFPTVFKRNFKQVILMQYTGLKDKNNKEIYEGDILKCTLGCSQMDQREHDVNAIVIFSKTGYGSAIGFTGKHLSGGIFALPCESALEVIGNIYENPDLVETRRAL